MNGMHSYAPREFLDRLSRNDIRPSAALRGMVKSNDDDKESLLFAHGSACAAWTRIPLAMIETIEFLNFVPCKDHTHPLVRLHLKQPETEEGWLFLSLLHASAAQKPRRPGRIVRGPRSTAGRGASTGANPTANADFPWCDTIAEVDIHDDGSVWCLDWCWESEQIAAYNPC